ncbi:MAG: hypothetical protein B6I19_04340 [Bacteroidetes bacterium 4572_114]|nr:MAG: hypothetical protein B6I19_04340 [Bacteroidetes bacterium 4572_114]
MNERDLKMKTKIGLLMLTFLIAIANLNAQDITETETDAELLGLPGDNLDLYATLDLFQGSKTIEEFEASLNDEKTGINNLDLNLDGNVDFIKVVTQKEDDDFAFVLQVDILDDDIQDVAVILVTKGKDEKVTIQMVGDEELYGKDYVIEPKLEAPAVTANPAYSGPDTVVVKSEPATVVVVESEPIVQYVYSPAYVPYYPPYYYGYYPVYYTPYPVISVNIYFGRNRHHRNHYYGGHRGGNTVVINNNTYNNYSRTRNTSNTVNKNKNEGNYKRNDASKSPSSGAEKNNKVNNQKSIPNSKENATKSSVKDNKSSVPTNKYNVKPSSKPANKPTTRPSSKPSSKPKGKPKRK